MSKEELLKYLIAEIDLIMHDKDYRFENANDTWYSRESCRDLTNEEVFEELRTELRQFANLEAKLAESEKQIKDARETANMTVDSWCKNRRKYEAQIAEMQNKSFILYSMLYETLEKQGCENVASQIDQMTGWTYDKEADWLKGNRNYDQLKQQLEEKEKLIERLQGVIDKLRDKKFAGKTLVEAVNAVYEPLFKNKCDEVEEFKQQLAELKEKLAQYENIEKEIGCDIEVFWKVYRQLSGHGKSDIHLYSIFNNEIVEIMPTEIISGTYSNYPQDCSFKYLVWNKICESYQETYSYFHFHDYNNEWFLSKEEAEQKLAEIKGEKDE